MQTLFDAFVQVYFAFGTLSLGTDASAITPKAMLFVSCHAMYNRTNPGDQRWPQMRSGWHHALMVTMQDKKLLQLITQLQLSCLLAVQMTPSVSEWCRTQHTGLRQHFTCMHASCIQFMPLILAISKQMCRLNPLAV